MSVSQILVKIVRFHINIGRVVSLREIKGLVGVKLSQIYDMAKRIWPNKILSQIIKYTNFILKFVTIQISYHQETAYNIYIVYGLNLRNGDSLWID